MKLSEKIQQYKDKGFSREKALTKIQEFLHKNNIEFNIGKQKIFNSVYPKVDITAPKDELSELEELFNTFNHDVTINAAKVFYKKMWGYYNHLHFNNSMAQPEFRFVNTTDKIRVLAHYMRATNTLSFSKRLFNIKFKDFCITFVHEMCHAAVYLLDHYMYKPGVKRDVHGKNWQKWMHHCGLDPERLARTNPQDFMDDQEREEYQKVKDVVYQKKSIGFVLDNMGVQVYDSKKKIWRAGRTICKDVNFRKTGYYLFTDKDEGLAFTFVPMNQFKELDDYDKSILDYVNSPKFKFHVTKLKELYLQNPEANKKR